MNFSPAASAYPKGRKSKKQQRELYIKYAAIGVTGLIVFYWIFISSWGLRALFGRSAESKTLASMNAARASRGATSLKSLSGQDLIVTGQSRLDEIELTVPIRSQTLEAPYVSADLKNRWFDFGGNAFVDTTKHIRLTQTRPSQSGYLWSVLQLAPHGYQILVDFNVGGSKSHLYGDGFAMWLTEQRSLSGSAFGASNIWHGVGIFFDTYANKRHTYGFPRITAIINDGSLAYDNSDDGESLATAACSMDIRRDDVQTRLRLTYVRGQFLQLDIQHRSANEWSTCFVIEGLDLPFNPYLGFTAHTGQVFDNHDIIAISTHNVNHNSKLNNKASGATKKSKFRSYTPKKVGAKRDYKILGGIFRFFKWVVILASVAAAGYFGYKKYATRQVSRKPPQLFL